MTALPIFLLICTVPLVACQQGEVIVARIVGNWDYATKDGKIKLGLIDCIRRGDVEYQKGQRSPGKLLLLSASESIVVECIDVACAKGSRKEIPQPLRRQAAPTESPGFWKSLEGQPGYKLPMSRSSSWQDTLVTLENTGSGPAIELADAFRTDKPRQILVRLCPVDPAIECIARTNRIDWNGSTAILSSPDLKPGLFRIVEGENASDAWVRVLSRSESDKARAAYASVVKDVDSWEIPEGFDPAPIQQRMKRIILSTAGQW
jgi:hypothetical protein